MGAKHTPGPWMVDGPPHNQIVWSDADNRVCFLAHSGGRDNERDIATGRLIAAAPLMADALLVARDFLLHADQSTGECMCGTAVESHSIGSGHAPVDAGAYQADGVVQQINAALAAAGITQEGGP